MTYVAKSAIGKVVMISGLMHCCLSIGQSRCTTRFGR